MTPSRPREANPTPEQLEEEGNAIWLEQQKRLTAPLDEPDVDDLEVAYAEVARTPYLFRWAGRQWTLPHIGELDYRVQTEIQNFGSDVTLERVDELFRKIFGPEQAEEWSKATQPGPFLDLLFKRWLAHSGSKPGESQASKPSSKTTGTKSRPTSGGGTGSASRRRSTAKKAAPKVVSLPVNSST